MQAPGGLKLGPSSDFTAGLPGLRVRLRYILAVEAFIQTVLPRISITGLLHIVCRSAVAAAAVHFTVVAIKKDLAI